METLNTMSARWKKTKIGQFLFERKGKYQPDDEIITGLRRIDKIDFSGNFHIATKSSKTNMILVKPGDFVISGIGLHNGSMGVYEGQEDITATIHYSSYTFDTDQINVEYFKRFLKSPEFVKLIKKQVRGGMRPEIKAKHLLPLEIYLPDIEEQQRIVSHFQSVETEGEELQEEIACQKNLLKKLRQQILQEAIEGNLTAEWRQQNPDVEPASELLARIQAEKEQLIKDKKIKKQQPLPPISDAEKPFDLPDGWVWCRLGELINISSGDGLISSNMKNGKILVFGGNGVTGHHDSYNTNEETITIGRVGAYCGAIHLTPKLAWITDNCFRVHYDKNSIMKEYLIFHLKNMNLGEASFKGAQPVISGKRIYPILTHIPPLPEQKAIVTKVEKLLVLCDQMETQITASQTHAKQLMQSALKEAFSHPPG